MGTAGPRQQSELDFRQTEFGRADGNPVMAGKGDFQTAAERRAMDGGDHGFRARLDAIAQFGQPQTDARLVEFGDVGAREEGPSAAGNDDRADICIGDGLGKRLRQSVANRLAERVDRRVVDRNRRHAGIF